MKPKNLMFLHLIGLDVQGGSESTEQFINELACSLVSVSE